jgi:hypothetical protein
VLAVPTYEKCTPIVRRPVWATFVYLWRVGIGE